jgi:hypothetical protein
MIAILEDSQNESIPALACYLLMPLKEKQALIIEAYYFVERGNSLPDELAFLQKPVNIVRQKIGPLKDPPGNKRPTGFGQNRPAKIGARPSKTGRQTGARKHSSKRAERIGLDQKDTIRQKLRAIERCWKPARICARPGTTELIRSLNKKDRDLAALWATSVHGKDYHDKYLAKMLSARLAEKAVLLFFEDAGHTVRDTSIQQVDGGAEWITHDLMVDNRIPIDVKNARSSVNSGAHYSECIVPIQKQDNRESHVGAISVDVRIAGVLSPYIRADEFDFPKKSYDPELTILGTTSTAEINRLAGQFASERLYLHIMPQLNTQWESVTYKYVYPPWLFTYPPTLYGSFFDGLSGLDSIQSARIPTLDELHRIKKRPPFYIFLAAGKPVPEQWKKELCAWQLELYSEIESQADELRLPFLFLTLLKHFTEQLHDPSNDFHPNGYRALIFNDGKGGMKTNGAYPLGIYDPLCLIHQLITNLATIWKMRKEYQLDRIQQFQFKGLGILRGRLPSDDHWTTILAFCGGTLPAKNHAKCGKPDLILGAEGVEVCPECHRLICPDPGCRYCWKDCEEYKRRYTKIFQQDEGILESYDNDPDIPF